MQFFKRWNNITGWAVFAVAAIVYLMTMEPVSSLWDCSEFIATSYKLEVGHPPGAPLFMMLARLATLFAFGNPDYVGIAVNAMNSLASAFCILFLFWTVTHLARRLLTRNGGELSVADTVAVLGAGAVGALAYTFTDTFWFSAIEGEVYALSSVFTALVVWLSSVTGSFIVSALILGGLFALLAFVIYLLAIRDAVDHIRSQAETVYEVARAAQTGYEWLTEKVTLFLRLREEFRSK